jgi:hypothetical protein
VGPGDRLDGLHRGGPPAGQGTTPVARAALVVTLAFVLVLAGCLTLYARRQVRD